MKRRFLLIIIIVFTMSFVNNLRSQSMSDLNEIFRDVVVNANLWSSLGYSHDGLFPSLEEEIYVLKFQNSNNRVIEVEALKGKVFRVTISRITDEDPGLNYEGGHTHFYLTDWLRRTGFPYTQYPFYASSYSGDFEEKVQAFLVFLGEAFNHPTLEGIIMGTEWGYFPFNWGTDK